MIQAYYVNNNQTRNPGYHHEVHTETHMKQLGIRSAIYVGCILRCPTAADAELNGRGAA